EEGIVDAKPDAVERSQSPIPEKPPAPDQEQPLQAPIAIVAMGCVLPGASNPEHYWRNIRDGVTGIVDLATIDANARGDFMADGAGTEPNIVSDKTYTLLNGSILEIPYDPEILRGALTEPQFSGLTRGQKLLALALGQSLAVIRRRPADLARIHCILGATADGSSEFDEATWIESLHGE